MKTKFLIMSLLLLASGLRAQNVSTNRSEMLRRALRQQYYNTGSNAPATPPAAAPEATTPTPAEPAAPSTTPKTPPAFPAFPTPTPRVRTTVPVHPAPPADADLDKPYEGIINFAGADLNSVLQLYGMLVNRTLLRAANLPSPPIVLKTQTALTKREAIQALDVVLGLNGIAVINFGDKFAKVVPVNQANQEAGGVSYQDVSELPDMGQYTTHVVQLQYAKPSEVLPVLQPFQKMGNAAIGIDSSGIIVLRDYTENVKRMLEMIARVDVSMPAEIESEVIPIKYALAGDIASALNSVSSGNSTTTVGASGSGGGGAGGGGIRGSGGGGLNGARTTTTYGGVGTSSGTGGRFGSQGNVNPNMGGGGGGMNPGTLGGGGAGGAGTFGDRIRAIINRASTGGSGGDFQIMGQTKIIADERTNSLLVFATHDDMLMVKSIIAKLDIVLAQVLIEAIIVDVTLGSGRSVGVSAAQEPAQMGPLAGGGGYANGPAFLKMAQSGTNLVSKLSSLSAFTTNIFNGLGSGFSYFGTLNQGWDFTVTALQTDNRVNILSRPRIQTSHAVPATLFIGQTIPYINGTTTDINGGNRSSYEQRDVGINLSVLPLINPEGLVVMDIQEDIEQLGQNVIIDGNPIPQTIRRSASAKVAVRDGDTIILGGFISTTKSKSKSGVPFLSSLPLLGYLFRQTTDTTERDELAVLLHPKVLPTPEIAAIASDEDQKQMPGVMRAKQEIGRAERKAMDDEQKRELKDDNSVKP